MLEPMIKHMFKDFRLLSSTAPEFNLEFGHFLFGICKLSLETLESCNVGFEWMLLNENKGLDEIALHMSLLS